MRQAQTLALLLGSLRDAAAQGSPWSGDMHPSIGFPLGCNISRAGDCAPSYGALDAAGALWPCPSGAPTSRTCGHEMQCVVGAGGDNPTCQGLSAAAPCCCPRPGCAAEPQFNSIIGVCKGGSCGCGAGARAPSCGGGRCGAQCNGTVVPCCFGADVSALEPYYAEGTHARVNYLAAYNFNASAQQWQIAEDSSFNTDGALPTCDLMQPYCGLANASQAWLAPQPGGSVFWSLGYYAAGVRGVGGGGGVMFVLSTEDWFGGTWYALNTLTLDRGPGAAYPKDKCAVTNECVGAGCSNNCSAAAALGASARSSPSAAARGTRLHPSPPPHTLAHTSHTRPARSNCWAAGNAGEMDFLEPGWSSPSAAALEYRQSFSTQDNQVGRCFQGGVNGGGFASKNYLLTEASPLSGAPAEPIVYVAVMDSVGNWVYRIPASQVGALWPGLGRTTAAAALPPAPARAPDSVNPGTTAYAGTFVSNCQATNFADARAQQCAFNGEQGFCGNWWQLFSDTHQPLYPSASCERDVRGGVAMPWCRSVVS